MAFTVLTMSFRTKNRERGQEDQTPKLSVSHPQLAVAVVIDTVFFLVYPGGLSRSYIDFDTPTEYERQFTVIK
jgi:hypothetical protein